MFNDDPSNAENADMDAELEPIEPLIEYYARQMGQLSGRLMTALSFLVDLEGSHGWQEQDAQTRESVHYSRLLIASVLKIVAAAQQESNIREELESARAIRQALKEIVNGKNGKSTR